MTLAEAVAEADKWIEALYDMATVESVAYRERDAARASIRRVARVAQESMRAKSAAVVLEDKPFSGVELAASICALPVEAVDGE